jgi:hypothetical protein
MPHSASQDVMLIHPALTMDWCMQFSEASSSDDSLLHALHAEYRELLSANLKGGFSLLVTSFLYNRVRHSDPFFAVRKLPRIPAIDFDDFSNDARFVRDLATLQRQPMPVLFLLLPDYHDLSAHRYQFSDQQSRLLHSLEELTHGGIISVMDSMAQMSGPLEPYFLLPHDSHPSALGAQFYAGAIVKVIEGALPGNGTVR